MPPSSLIAILLPVKQEQGTWKGQKDNKPRREFLEQWGKFVGPSSSFSLFGGLPSPGSTGEI